MTVSADDGYTLRVLTAASGTQSLTLKSLGNGKYSFIMPAANVKVSASFDKGSKLPFTDIPVTFWSYADILWAYDNNYMKGVTETKFSPNSAINQAIIVQVLARMANADLTALEGVSYPEIPDGQWYTTAAAWARQAGLLPDGTFDDARTTSRENMAIMLAKYLRRMGVDVTVSDQSVRFADADKMSQEGSEAFQILYQLGIFKGIGNGYMDPTGLTSRAQFAALIHRMSALIER